MQTSARIGRMLLLAQAVLLFACKKNDGFGPSNTAAYADTATPLKDAASFPIGVAVSYTPLLNDAQYVATVKRDFDAVTFDYNMKHGALVKNDGTLDFTQADAMVNALNGVDIFGHTLGWYQNQNATYLKTAAGLVNTLGAELLQNPGFESGLGNWSVWNTGNPAGTSTVTAATDAHSGTGSMKVVNPVGYPNEQWRVQVASNLYPTVSGRQYTFSYWVKSDNPNGSIRLSTQDQNNANAQYQGNQTTGTAWQKITWTITANSAQTRVLFDLGQAANTYYIDDASFKEVIPGASGPQTPGLVDQALNSYITAVVNHFKSRVHSWDVVNELFTDDGSIRNNTNTNAQASDIFVWSEYLGRNFGLKAFNYAKAADPTAELFINDYNLESNGQKLDSLISYVSWLKAQGAKVDGIGTQMHISTGTALPGIDNMMQKLAATGLKVRISELDVKTNRSATSTPVPPNFDTLATQAVMYKYVVSSYLRNVPPAQRAGITVWGLTDNTSWLYNNGRDYPLLYDRNYNRKPAYASFLKALKENP